MTEEENSKEPITPQTTLNPTEVIQPESDEIDGYPLKIITAREYKDEREKIIQHLISGTPLDELMRISNVGWETASVYEVYGENGVGKTQLCNTMSVLNDYDVVWIDGGEDTFRPERIMEIAKLRGKDPESTLDRIHIIHAFNASHLEAIVTRLPRYFMNLTYGDVDEGRGKKKRKVKKVVGREWINGRLKTGKIGLVILDSLAPTFTLQYQGVERLAPRQRAILRVIACMRLMSIWFNCVVIITNQIRSSPGHGGAFMPVWVTQKPVGGPTVGHNIDFQIMIRKGKNNIRIARVVDSSNTDLGEIEFVITPKGIEAISEPEDNQEIDILTSPRSG